MSELIVPKQKGLEVCRVSENSPAARGGVLAGDVIIKVNDKPIKDVIDFRYLSSEKHVRIGLLRNGKYLLKNIERDWGEEFGIEFRFEVSDGIHTCNNKCVFCFIHQMPKGMRKSLYLMDDDYRLSFLHGNYVTLTNMSEKEFERLKSQKISPLYVSVHATDPRLRGFLLGKNEPQPILPRLNDLHSHGIDVHCQIVLCPGINDGTALEKTIQDLASLHPRMSKMRGGVLSVAIVPVGLSKYRHNLYPIRAVTYEEAQKLLKQTAKWHRRFRSELGTRFVFPSDEWFFLAKRSVPSRKWYEDFPQLEDGVGTCRLFLDEAQRGLANLARKSSKKNIEPKMRLTLITGALAGGIIEWFAEELSRWTNYDADVCVVKNHFFGEGITVAGLLTGRDIISTLRNYPPEKKARGIVLVPDIALKDEMLFLDDLTIHDVRAETGLDVRVCPSRARNFFSWYENSLKAA
ncbi:MAG TPA: DUF512 domain-containing protein [Fimbriimonadales bacterium]|nr:DUF512 domain-containing protein [Fimbriimonadales bacterium]